MTASGAQQGIYEVFLRGTASAPYQSRVHSFLAKVVVSGQSTEYVISSSESQKSTTMFQLIVAGRPTIAVVLCDCDDVMTYSVDWPLTTTFAGNEWMRDEYGALAVPRRKTL